MRRTIATTLISFLMALLATPAAQAQRIQLRLLNMSDIPFGPVVVATHPATLSPLMNASEAPSPSLRTFASSGDAGVLLERARRLGGYVHRLGFLSHAHVQAGRIPDVPPGQAVTAEIPVAAHYRNVSLAGRLGPGAIVGFGATHVPGETGVRTDVLAWEVGDRLIVHRTVNSPVARVWLRYLRPRAPLAGLPALTAAQARERSECLAASPTCVWRLERGAGLCADCVPPLRPNAARTHCVD